MTTPYTVQLLRASLPNIALHGFTPRCILASNRELAPLTLATLFPGPETASTSAPRRLFEAWDEEALAALLPPGGDRKVRLHPPSKAEERQRYDAVVETLVQRLRASREVRGALIDGLSLISRRPIAHLVPLSSRLHSYPTPLPLLLRSQRIASSVLAHPSLDYPDSDAADWYAVRARLALAFLAAELHVASCRSEWHQSCAYLRRIAHGRETSLPSDARRLGEDAKAWTTWGGRGWLGTLRSWGL